MMSNRNGEYFATDFGIRMDGRELLDVTTEGGSPEISSGSARFTESDIGKSVTLYHSSGYLLTTIASVESHSAATLSDNAPETTTNSRLIFGTDDTLQIETAIKELDAGNGGVLIFPMGIAVCAGPIQDPTGRNGVILVPNRNTGRMNAITLRGSGAPMVMDNGFLQYRPSLSGSVIFCPTAADGVEPALFNGSNPAGGLSCIDFRCEGLTFRRARGSLLGEFQFRHGGGLSFDRCVIGPDFNWMSEFLSQPYPVGQTSIVFPNSNNGGSVGFSNGRISGAGTAIKGSQHFVGERLVIVASDTAVAFDSQGGGGEIKVSSSHFVGCRVNFFTPLGIPIGSWNVDGVALENYATAPYIHEWDFFDESGTASTGRACVLLLTSADLKSNTDNVAITTRGFNQAVYHHQPIVLKGNERLILRQADGESFPGIEIHRTDGSIIGLLFGAAGEPNHFIIQGGSGANVSVRNGDLKGLVIRPNGTVTLTDGLGVGNTALASTPGTVVRKMEIFDQNGASLGFIPIFDAVT